MRTAALGCVLLASSAQASQSRAGRTKSVIRDVRTALFQFLIEHDALPTEDENLFVLLEPAADEAPYLKGWPMDAWGRAILYFRPARRCEGAAEVLSMGRDGRLGTRDDICVGLGSRR